MKRRRILLLLALALLAAGFVLFWPSGPKEPVYQGKRLSKWMRQAQGIEDAESESLAHQRSDTARKAIQSIGTNALPYLLSEFTRPISQWRVSFNNWAEGKPMVPFRFRNEEERIWRAADGLKFLGPDAAAALPVLAGCLADPQRGDAAAYAMSGAGTSAVPYLLPAIAGTNLFTAARALECLDLVAKENKSAVPLEVQFVLLTNATLRQWAVSRLNGIESRMDLTVPALMAALSHPEWRIRCYAANALGGIGPRASVAVPELLRMTTNSSPAVAEAASNAVLRIAPAALAPRGP